MTSIPRRTPQHDHDEPPGAWLSALVDGHPEGLDEACRRWNDDATVRRDWHAFHLIGDVMRSEELAARPGRDAAFLAGLRQRLAEEPVVLAPVPVQKRRQAWLVPAAAAAGFVVVAGVLVVVRMGQAPQPDAQVADAAPPARGVRVEVPVPVAHDPALDPYVRAHRQFGPGITVTAPGYPLRNADYVPPQPVR